MAIWVAPAFLVPDDGEAFAQGGGQVGQDIVHRKSLKRGGLWRKRPL